MVLAGHDQEEHLKSKPLDNQTIIEHLNTEHVRYSDAH